MVILFKTFKLSVYPLENRIKLNTDGSLYNTSKFKYSSNEIGNISFLPRPTKTNYLKINLDNSYGLSLFNLIKTGNVDSQEYFLNFFKGLPLLVPSSTNEAFLNFGIGQYNKTLTDEDITTVMENVLSYQSR